MTPREFVTCECGKRASMEKVIINIHGGWSCEECQREDAIVLSGITGSFGAKFSDCRKYRYVLWRTWDKTRTPIAFIGLNPSTANETKADATITRVVNFAKSWGYGGVYMLNLFAIVSSKPEILLTDPDPTGSNDVYLKVFSRMRMNVVFAWGGFKQAQDRAKNVEGMFVNPYCLKKNSDGSPHHPLRIPSVTKPQNYFTDGQGK